MQQVGPNLVGSQFLRFSVRGMLLIVFVVAVGLAGFGANDKLWTAFLNNLNVAALIASGVIAIYRPRKARAFCVGFLLGDGALTVLEFVPALGRPLVQRMLAWQLWHPHSPNHLSGAAEQRAVVGALFTGWLYGTVAGLLAVWLQSKHQRRTTAKPAADCE